MLQGNRLQSAVALLDLRMFHPRVVEDPRLTIARPARRRRLCVPAECKETVTVLDLLILLAPRSGGLNDARVETRSRRPRNLKSH